ncbi:hypothetical protein QAD02_024413 [Eretmocerus hayati]|uniref:Uncharacterized protein n=1 Tax=Eretmocerus hayati TaxID=131215 RepID=A0ACC2Q098_9HYME|nr:hypothetical protein QAD02_024413 [Eretmocerus hayati]
MWVYSDPYIQRAKFAFISECESTGFSSVSGVIEKVPYVMLPQYGQIVYPDAEIKFEGELSDLISSDSYFYQLGTRRFNGIRAVLNTIEQETLDIRMDMRGSSIGHDSRVHLNGNFSSSSWTGDWRLRELAEGKIVVVKLACRDSYRVTLHRGVFTPCLAFRVAGSPSRSSIKEVSFSASDSEAVRIDGLTSSEVDRENDDGPRIKCNPLLAVGSRYFGSDDNLSGASGDGEPYRDKPDPRHNSSEAETDEDPNVPASAAACAVTSAVVHPHEEYSDSQEQSYTAGALVGERLPEEDVRVVETTENGNQQGVPIFPGTQRRKLYFNPAYFDRSLLLAPPPAAIEFLLKIREVISIAKHKMAAKRFIPTLNEIPEERSSLERDSGTASRLQQQQQPRQGRRRRSSSAQGAPRRQQQQQQQQSGGRCDGCPGCGGRFSSTPDLAQLHQPARHQQGFYHQREQHLQGTDSALSGESRVRAWLEDVKLIDARWRHLQQRQQHQTRSPTRLTSGAGDSTSGGPVDPDMGSLRDSSSRSLPPVFRGSSRGIGRDPTASCLDAKRNSDAIRHLMTLQTSGSSDESRSSRSRGRETDPLNAKARLSIENSFRKQIEQLLQRSASGIIDNKSSLVLSNADRIRTQLEISQSVNGAKDGNEIAQMEDTRMLLSIINDELSSRNSDEAKLIMDAVIQELAVSRGKDKHADVATNNKSSDYETDSLEKTRASRKSSSSPVLTEKSSPAQSSVLPMDEELTMRNAMIDMSISTDSSRPNVSSGVGSKHNLPEVVPMQQQQHSEHYALVSEVYVNDGYASPSNSDDDSGPEIQYEPEKPGHLTIRVVDSPNNYVRQDESEYEPDTLDRKPMKLKVNGDITYEKQDIVNEVYVDSLERSSQILLRSRSSFRRDDAKNVRDRSFAGAGDPTICEEASVAKQMVSIVGKSTSNVSPDLETALIVDEPTLRNAETVVSEKPDTNPFDTEDEARRTEKRQQHQEHRTIDASDGNHESGPSTSGSNSQSSRSSGCTEGCCCGGDESGSSNSCSQEDEGHTCHSESGAESVGTDSVFFGKFDSVAAARAGVSESTAGAESGTVDEQDRVRRDDLRQPNNATALVY